MDKVLRARDEGGRVAVSASDDDDLSGTAEGALDRYRRDVASDDVGEQGEQKKRSHARLHTT